MVDDFIWPSCVQSISSLSKNYSSTDFKASTSMKKSTLSLGLFQAMTLVRRNA